MIISIKSSASGGSSRGLVHYLAHSKFDREREGVERREFFTESENDLDVSRANRHLSSGEAKAKPEELLHVVIAPSKEEIESVGETQETKKNALKEIVREVVARLETEVKATNLKWVAVAHFNTDNPHAHLAVQKQFTNENGDAEILRINRQMLHYNERDADGEKKLHKGALILTAENKVNELAGSRRQAREVGESFKSEKAVEKSKTRTEKFKEFSAVESAKIPNYRERRILAQEMLVAAEIRRRERNIENLVEHGDKKRFKIKDSSPGQPRHVSRFDIERKIETVSRRKAQIAQPVNAEKRIELATQLAQEERAAREPVIKQLETIRRHILGFESRHLGNAQAKHTRLQNQKLLIEKKYERSKSEMPLPLFEPGEIQRLQTEAIREQNSEKTLRLEAIRQSNAAELNLPSRRERDVRELLASRIVSKLKIEAAEKRLLGLAASKDFVKVKIGDSHFSHNGLRQHEFEAARKNDFWARAKSKTRDFLFRSDKKISPAEKLYYPALHKVVGDALVNLENVRWEEIARQKEFDQTLDKIFDKETNPNKNKLAPAFSAFELAEAEDLAADAGRENFYENSLAMQESWLREKLAEKISSPNVSNEIKNSGEIEIQKRRKSVTETAARIDSETPAEVTAEKTIGDFILGRAEARSLLAEMKANQAKENLTKYERDKPFVKHRIKDPKTGAEYELSLRDVEPKSHYYLLDTILERALESKELKFGREQVRQAAGEKEKELTQNLKAAETRVSRLKDQKTLMLEKFSAAPEVQPLFTPKEIAALDARRDRAASKSEADQLGKIISEAEKFGRVERLQEFLQRAAKELETIAPELAKQHDSTISREDESTGGRQAVVETRETSRENAVSETVNRADHGSVKSGTAAQEKIAVREKGRSR